LERCIWIGEREALAAGDPRARTVRSPHAPRFDGDPHPRQNVHQSTGSDWDAFCLATDLHGLFLAPGSGLMAEQPGTVRLAREHARAVHAALEQFIYAHRGADASFASGRAEDGHLARLLWLDWWMHWAIRRCEAPAIHNE
jgi:hypothetical protein